MKFAATNPKTDKLFILSAKDKQAFILELVKKAPHHGWYPDEVHICVQEDMIEELPAC